MMQVHSPLTGSTNVVLEKEILCSFIIDDYRKHMDFDVTRYFHNLESIQIYRCLDTGFRFYYPFDIDGDSEFYKVLQKQSWYYMDWKWEHEIASMLIEQTDRVLEIGCARGGFLERINQKGIKCVGLELNESALECSRARALEVSNQSIEDHAKENQGQYDVVCSFQVVEHIAAVREFMQASINALKPAGKLIVSVPNNFPNSPILKDNILNMPPHHMGLWDTVSLANLQSVFPLRLERLEMEPIQKYHLGYYQSYIRDRSIKRYPLLGRVINRISKSVTENILSDLSNFILCHTILALYEKL